MFHTVMASYTAFKGDQRNGGKNMPSIQGLDETETGDSRQS